MDTWPGTQPENSNVNFFTFGGQSLKKDDIFSIMLPDCITSIQVKILTITKKRNGTVIALLQDTEIPGFYYSINENGCLTGGGRVTFNSKP